jgi:hypothetical protein
MNKLSATSVAAEYTDNMGTEVLLGKIVVKVCNYINDSRSGSYERGFKFSTITYGYLTRKFKTRMEKYSPDHGITWYDNFYDMKKQRAGKIKLDAYKRNEFSFNAIQQINVAYNKNYKWKP